MKKNKIAGVLFATLMLVSSALSAGEGPTVKPNGCKGPVLCSSFPIYGKEQDCCDYRWHVDIGLLYEQPWFYGMSAGMVSYGQSFTQTLATGVDYANTVGTDLEVCFDYTAGITASLGHLMEHDNWYVGAKFDWLSSNISNKIFEQNNAFYIMGLGNVWTSLFGQLPGTPPTVEGGLVLPTYYTSLVFNANIDIYQLDVVLSRGSFHSKCFSYEPYAGVKALWYSGSCGTRGYNYSTANVSTDFAAPADNAYWSFAMNAWGVGPMFGFNGEYHITEGVSLFSDSDIAVMYGKMSSNYGLLYTLETITDNTTHGALGAKYGSKQEYYVPVRSIIGLQLAQFCFEDKHFVAVKIGYDARYVFARSAPLGAGDIASSGLYLNFIWDF